MRRKCGMRRSSCFERGTALLTEGGFLCCGDERTDIPNIFPWGVFFDGELLALI